MALTLVPTRLRKQMKLLCDRNPVIGDGAGTNANQTPKPNEAEARPICAKLCSVPFSTKPTTILVINISRALPAFLSRSSVHKNQKFGAIVVLLAQTDLRHQPHSQDATFET